MSAHGTAPIASPGPLAGAIGVVGLLAAFAWIAWRFGRRCCGRYTVTAILAVATTRGVSSELRGL